MTFTEKINTLKYMHSKIQHKATGRPQAFADKIGVSESTLYNYIKEMKSLGAPIKYDRTRHSYCYATPVLFILECQFISLASVGDSIIASLPDHLFWDDTDAM